jgi:hypothetical protein
MRPAITWYDILGALPDASAGEIQHAYDAKADLLRPQLLSGAPSKVITAASRAQGIIDAAQRVLGDPVSLSSGMTKRASLWGSGGPGRAGGLPSRVRLPDSDFAADNPGADVLNSLGALNLWLDRHPEYQRRIPVPDVRGLFYDVFVGVVGRLDLKVTFVQLTEHPMQVEGLVVDQSPEPPAKIHQRGELTVHVWHPPA